MDVCVWAEEKAGKIYRCTSKSIEDIYIEDELVALCPTHLATVKRMLRKKTEYEGLLEQVHEEQRKLLEQIHELQSLVANKAGQDVTCKFCHTAFQHDGTLGFQTCPKCKKNLII